ncbi:MAG TPA: polysaccharide deacetylase family protein [Chryseolinea sp.]|nr:polysaccharide deacetylase family protein [Chryseolinea sp.]
MRNKVSILKYLLLLEALLFLSCTGNTQQFDKKVISENADKTVICFVYHRFGDSRYPSTNVSVSDFELHIQWLKKHKYQILSLSEAIQYLESDDAVRKVAVITIDDGYKSFIKNGLPVLKKYKASATLYINTGTVGGGDYMDWSELKTVVNNNIEIGNHTHSHSYFLNELASTRYSSFKDEIELSQSIIQKHLNFTPVTFSYPYGEFDAKMEDIVKQLGFKSACAQNSGVIYSGSDVFKCPRFPMSEAYSSLDKFVEKASAKPLVIAKISPENSQLPSDRKPILTLTLNNKDLQLDQLQCFVQGGKCSINRKDKTDTQTTISFQSATPFGKRRRTLYTITVPDKNGIWHWYSHLWVDASIRE